jgi:hypothetical protein
VSGPHSSARAARVPLVSRSAPELFGHRLTDLPFTDTSKLRIGGIAYRRNRGRVELPRPPSHGVRGRGLGILALGRRQPQHHAAWVDSCAGARRTPAVGKPRCFNIARIPSPAFTYDKTHRLPPHLTQANTSKSNVLFSNSAQSTRGVLSFIRSFLAAASLQALASSAWGNLNDFAHLWLNYQIEHHLWPDLPMLKYPRGAAEGARAVREVWGALRAGERLDARAEDGGRGRGQDLHAEVRRGRGVASQAHLTPFQPLPVSAARVWLVYAPGRHRLSTRSSSGLSGSLSRKSRSSVSRISAALVRTRVSEGPPRWWIESWALRSA